MIGLIAAAAIGGVPLGWYRRFVWYDDLMHAAFGFAIASTIGA